MNKEKYFRVVKRTNRKGKTVFKTQSAETFFDMLFGYWTEYTFENKDLPEAIEQIEIISQNKIDSEQVVYKKTIR